MYATTIAEPAAAAGAARAQWRAWVAERIATVRVRVVRERAIAAALPAWRAAGAALAAGARRETVLSLAGEGERALRGLGGE